MKEMFSRAASTFAPSRGRELKYSDVTNGGSPGQVRPLAGAGIEIVVVEIVPIKISSPPRGGGN